MREVTFIESPIATTPPFVGREWLEAAVAKALDEQGTTLVLIEGSPGVGKSALLAHLASRRTDSFTYSLRTGHTQAFELPDAKSFLLAFGFHLAQVHPELFVAGESSITVEQYVELLEEGAEAVGADVQRFHASPFASTKLSILQSVGSGQGRLIGLRVAEWVAEHRQLSVEDLFDLAIVRPMQALNTLHPGQVIRIHIDALDEIQLAGTDRADKGASLLTLLCDVHRLPPNLKVLVTSRPGHFLAPLRHLNHVHVIRVDESAPENLRDLREFIGMSVSALDPRATPGPDFTEQLLESAAGNFLYAALVLRSMGGELDASIEGAGGSFRTTTPQGLPALYRVVIARLEASVQARYARANWSEVLGPLLGSLAVARRALTYAELALITGLEHATVTSLVGDLNPILHVGADGSVGVFHASLAEHLLSNDAIHPMRQRDVALRMFECVVAAWGGMEAGLPRCTAQPDSGYAIQFMALHLVEAGNAVEAARFLSTPRVLTARLQVSGPRRLLADFALIRDGLADAALGGRLQALSVFLGRFGAWLMEHPQSALPQLVDCHFRLRLWSSREMDRYVGETVVPACHEMFPHGCLWTNEATPRPEYESVVGAGALQRHNVEYATGLANGMIAVCGGLSPLFVFDHNGLVRRIDIDSGFKQAVFTWGANVGIVLKEFERKAEDGEGKTERGPDLPEAISIMSVDLTSGEREEVFEYRQPGCDSVVRAATLTASGGVALVTAQRSGKVRYALLRRDHPLLEKDRDVGGFVTAAAFQSDEAVLIAVTIDADDSESLGGEMRQRRALAAARSRRVILRWHLESGELETLRVSQTSFATIVAKALKSMARGTVTTEGNLYASVDAVVPLRGGLCFGQGDSLYVQGEDGTARVVYRHDGHIRGVVRLGEQEVLVMGGIVLRIDIGSPPKAERDSWDNLAALPDGQVLLLEDANPRAIWNPQTNRRKRISVGGFMGLGLRSAVVGRHGTLAMVPMLDGGIAVLTPSAFGVWKQHTSAPIWAVAAAPDGRILALGWTRRWGDADYRLSEVDALGIKGTAATIPKDRIEELADLFFDADGDLVLVTRGGKLLGWDLAAGETKWETQLEGFKPSTTLRRGVGALSGGRFAGSDTDGTVGVWSRSGTLVATLLAPFPGEISTCPVTDQISVVAPNGRTASLSIRRDPRSLSQQPPATSIRALRPWRFRYFPPGVQGALLARWRAAVPRRFMMWSALALVIGCIKSETERSVVQPLVSAGSFGLFMIAVDVVFNIIVWPLAHWNLNRKLRASAGKGGRA